MSTFNALRAFRSCAIGLCVLAAAQATNAQTQNQARQAEPDRAVLPIPEPAPAVYTELDARNATPPAQFRVTAPKGAPNVLIILLDDMGFGDSSAFGGPIHMPTVDRLAQDGLRYNQFHTTALCSPTRIALLTGRNHHVANMGIVGELATAFPGNTGQRPNSVAPVAEMLRLNGYATAAFGKSHETAVWEQTVSGPTDRWPTRSGFDKFYGFIAGEMNQWDPVLYEDMTPVQAPRDPNYHLLTDMTDHAIDWVRAEKSLTPDKPFFVYYAPGAVHAPHHAPQEWTAKYKGRFDQGWDRLREETFARQKTLHVVPAGTVLAPKPREIAAWNSLSADERKLFAGQMEVYAGYGEYADAEAGRLISAIEQLGQLDNTLVFYIIGDNGASAEGGMTGRFNATTYANGVTETVPDLLRHLGEWGGAGSLPHYAAGWAVAGDTPFTWTKQVASSYGGTRNGMVVHWPQGIRARNEVRSQWSHVIDVAPTILEAAHLPQPAIVDGTPQVPIQGASLLYSFDDARAADRHTTQYFEVTGNRGIYHDGWFAGTIHRAPWERSPRHRLQEDVWELYDTRTDFSLSRDLAAANPAKLKEMQDLFMHEAALNHVLPIDDRSLERLDARTAGRPELMLGRDSITLYPGMSINEGNFINLRNASHTITADLDVPTRAAEGVILEQGGRFGGWSLYVKDGKPAYDYNYLGIKLHRIAATRPLPAGKAVLKFEFTYDGGGAGKGGTGRILVNGEQVAEGRIEATQCCLIALEETADVGRSAATPVSDAYRGPFVFSGTLRSVAIERIPLPGAPPK